MNQSAFEWKNVLLYSASGQLIETFNNLETSQKHTWQHALSAGIYVLHIQNESINHTMKFIAP